MQNHGECNESEIIQWRKMLDDLLVLGFSLREQAFSMSGEEDFELMISCFLEKQIEHAMAVLGLVDLELYRDAGLIVRSMLEGLIQLLWASQDINERPTRWREFTCVSDWRKLKKYERAGRETAIGKKDLVENRLCKVAHKFYTQRANKYLAASRPLPNDPYVTNWMGISYRKCFQAVGAGSLLDFSYADVSAWHHWEPEGFGESIKVQPGANGIVYSLALPSLRAGAQALTNGFQCLFQTLEIADKRFDLGIRAKLNFLRRNYLKLGDATIGE